MNQTCKVCGEPAAGFHFGAFTCEGCKSFFGRSYNNLNAIADCKNNGECTINKKNRTACKACRLRKCLLVGMSKSGSRYGRRSNWFKIHCLLQEQQNQQQQQQQQAQQAQATCTTTRPNQRTPPPHPQTLGLGLFSQQFSNPLMHLPRSREELMLLGLDGSASPSVSSPESHNSDSSVEVSDARNRLPVFPGLLPPTFLPPPALLFPPGYPTLYHGLLQPAYAMNNNTSSTNNNNNNSTNTNNNNNRLVRNHNPGIETYTKRQYLDEILKSQRSATPDEAPAAAASPIQDVPIDLSMKTGSDRGSSPANSERSGSVTPDHNHRDAGSEADEESGGEGVEKPVKRLKFVTTPLDLTTKV